MVASTSGNWWWINLFCLIVSVEVCVVDHQDIYPPWHKIVFLLVPNLQCSNISMHLEMGHLTFASCSKNAMWIQYFISRLEMCWLNYFLSWGEIFHNLNNYKFSATSWKRSTCLCIIVWDIYLIHVVLLFQAKSCKIIYWCVYQCRNLVFIRHLLQVCHSYTSVNCALVNFYLHSITSR